ncbi:hypothetical protein WV31_14505 [Magnetospirillum sp. ME-1]|uniref:hypothetical protein n=1 Tax=Magnetospirillum sp. ME-1 TaxID=1639348 RepID=UPI000A17CC6B|nr:hypothetical protein [Magnetospirillum sp. ME-1]ARJ66795.1 hypothetical protein WV31_14505 [Magnetospirillum sp. ME-1]
MTSALARRIGRIEARAGLNRARSAREMTDEELDEAIRAIMAGEGGLGLQRSWAMAGVSDDALKAKLALLAGKLAGAA